MDNLHQLLITELDNEPLGETNNFIWFITDIGILAKLKNNQLNTEKIKPELEALEISLDLTKEEKDLQEYAETI